MRLYQEYIENGMFELIRLELVSRGHLPDVNNYLNPVNNDGYEAAKAGITDLIEVFNPGSYHGRGDMKTNDIIIDRDGIEPAMTGTMSEVQHKLNQAGTEYNKVVTARQKYDLTYKITYVTYSQRISDIIEDCIRQALGTKKFIQSLDSDAQDSGGFWLEYLNFFELSGSDFIERQLLYETTNIDLIGDTLPVTVPIMEDFEFDPVPARSSEIKNKNNFLSE